MKDKHLKDVERLKSSVNGTLRAVKSLNSIFVARQSIRDNCKHIAREWFESIEPVLREVYKLPPEILDVYHSRFDALLQIGMSKNSRTNTVVQALESITGDMDEDILRQVIKHSQESSRLQELKTILSIASHDESEYLEEAIKCAEFGFFRAAVILGWCAAVSRLHNYVTKVGIDTFNKKTKQMVEIKEGRFKRYNNKYTLQTPKELRAVFDSHLLWVLEFMGAIDKNQHERLELCFTMRNNCAHPGDAPLSEQNLLSFFSDVENIVFRSSELSPA